MKILGIVGSPRKRHNTDLLVEQILQGASAGGAETEKIYLNDLNIRPCQYCNYCRKKGICRLEDDMQAVYQKLEEAAGVVIGTPTFYGDISAQTKTFIDRCYRYVEVIDNGDGTMSFPSRFKERKKLVMVSVCGSFGPETFEKQVEVIKLLCNDLNAEYLDQLLVPKTDWYPVKDNREILERAFQIGIRLAHKG
ncbi:flavodoxin family protein [Zhaonella formicivorans]|jgi:multimeric flavodoxin WrbA|uniref:flavodoxin family protein n=1 Tax=Zhaonella formicivorans TaxID=2528593 RepID=UPI0010E5800F|nr:flavodoxin family protein [Zhaonella formicivorans]